jgi:hypothetical protein
LTSEVNLASRLDGTELQCLIARNVTGYMDNFLLQQMENKKFTAELRISLMKTKPNNFEKFHQKAYLIEQVLKITEY